MKQNGSIILPLCLLLAMGWNPARAGEGGGKEKPAASAPEAMKPIDDFDSLGVFKIEPPLKKRVRFWIEVYSKYSKWEMVLHDAQYPQIIFDVVQTRALRENPRLSYAKRQADAKRVIEEHKKKISQLLMRLHENQEKIEKGEYALSPEEKKIYQQYADVQEKDKFLHIVNTNRRIRGQYGLKESFVEGLYESGRYLPGMKQIAVRLGLPPEIVYLPFLESGFDRRALSKVGASGLWQFMPSTGRFFLRVDDVVDERNDPMKAAEGAALLMRDNLSALEEWPLAITAYNHGRSGMARAVRTVKSNSLAKIVEEYDGPNFGFASANFYSAFIAAVHVAQNAAHYFGDVDRAEPFVFEEFVMPEFMDIQVLAKNVGIDLDVLKNYNPGLTAAVYSGKKLIPVGYTLRIPYDKREDFLVRYKAIPAEYRLSRQKEDEPGEKKGLAKNSEANPSGEKQEANGGGSRATEPPNEDSL